MKKQNLSFIGKILLVVVAAVSIIFVAASSFSNVTFSNITGGVKSFFHNMKKGEGYPYECSAQGLKKADGIGSYLSVIDDSTVVFLNKTAKEVFRHDTTYTSPDMAISNGRALIYNRGSSSFLVTGQSDLLYNTDDTTGKLDGAIITGNIGENGSLVFGTLTKEGTSKFVALNRKLSTDFYYVFGKDRVLYVTVSDNGKYGACAVFGVENASYYSTVYIFDFDKEEPIQKIKLSGETVIRLDFLKNKSLSVITDLKRREISVNDKEEENVVDYSAHSLVSVDFDLSSKKSVLCYSKYGSTANVICGFYKNGNESCRIEDVENVKSVSCDSDTIAVLTDNQVLCYSYRGNLKSTIDLTFNVESVKLESSGLYLFSGSDIYRTRIGRDFTFETE